MKLNILCVVLLLLALLPLVNAATTHCLRADVNRGVSPVVEIEAFGGVATSLNNYKVATTSNDYNFIVPVGSVITFKNFGTYNFYCDDGASGSTTNYFDVYDVTMGTILATNVLLDDGTYGGPANTSSPMCSHSADSPCYMMNGQYITAHGTCDIFLSMGKGNNDSIILPLNQNMFGPHTLQLRLGAISPAGVDKYNPVIWPTPKLTFTIFVGTPNMLIFGQQGLKRMNYFETSGTASETALFTITNKSKYIEVIDNYNVKCTENTICSLDTITDESASGAIRLQYKGFRILPGESMIIPARVTIDKARTPYSFFSLIDLNYYVMADANHPITDAAGNTKIYSTHSTQTKIEAGLLDKQDFQISVIQSPVQRECVSAEGEAGVTGEQYAPKVNLYFGTNSPSTPIGNTTLISKDECTQNSANDNSWVYCSQREFLVVLAQRIREAYIEMASANRAESDSNFSGAQIHRNNALNLLNFDAHLRAQSLTTSNITSSADRLTSPIFTNIGFEPMTKTEFKNLSTAIKFQKTFEDTVLDDTEIEPGIYQIKTNISDIALVSSASQLFKNDETVADGLNITVSMEKKESPKFDWFFYYDKNTDRFPDKILPATNPSLYTTNVDARGTILTFEKGSDLVGEFYKTVAIPIMAKISDKSGSGANSTFEVPDYSGDIFTYWTGFASNEPNKAGVKDGCTNPFTQKALPYRVADEKNTASGKFIMPESSGTKQNAVMYLQTVLYVPVLNGQLTIQNATFGLQWLGYTNCPDGNSDHPCDGTIQNIVGNYPGTQVLDLNDVFTGIKTGSICVYEDNSLSNPRWKVFWNQDRVLEGLNADRNAIIGVEDVNICATRKVFSN